MNRTDAGSDAFVDARRTGGDMRCGVDAVLASINEVLGDEGVGPDAMRSRPPTATEADEDVPGKRWSGPVSLGVGTQWMPVQVTVHHSPEDLSAPEEFPLVAEPFTSWSGVARDVDAEELVRLCASTVDAETPRVRLPGGTVHTIVVTDCAASGDYFTLWFSGEGPPPSELMPCHVDLRDNRSAPVRTAFTGAL